MRAELQTASDDTLRLEGEIRDTANKTLVSTVFLRKGVASTFQLPTGKYVYLFHVDVGAGAFSLAVTPSKTPPGSFDTSTDGDYGLSYPFQV